MLVITWIHCIKHFTIIGLKNTVRDTGDFVISGFHRRNISRGLTATETLTLKDQAFSVRETRKTSDFNFLHEDIWDLKQTKTVTATRTW